MASSASENRSQMNFNKGSCRMVLKNGDLLSENVDVIVVPSPHREDNKENFLIYKRVYAAADAGLKAQINKVLSQLERGKGHFIRHRQRHYILSPPPYLQNPKTARELLGKLYSNCLTVANENHMQTIAFPTIGCGSIGFKTAEVAEVIYHVLENFDQNKCKSLKEIRIVIFQQNDYVTFADVFMDLSKIKNAKIKLQEILEDNAPSSKMGSSNSANSSKATRKTDEKTDYPDDFESDEKNEKKSSDRKSNLDPNAQIYVPKSKSREIQLNNKKTNLLFSLGNLPNTKADAIVNIEQDGHSSIAQEAGRDFADIYKEFKQRNNNKNIKPGHSRILPSCDLKSTSYIIKTMPPSADSSDTERLTDEIQLCYQTSLALANLFDLKSIAFPPIHCDINDKTTELAIRVALKTINDRAESLSKIFIVCTSEDLCDLWSSIAQTMDLTSSASGDAAADGKENRKGTTASK